MPKLTFFENCRNTSYRRPSSLHSLQTPRGIFYKACLITRKVPGAMAVIELSVASCACAVVVEEGVEESTSVCIDGSG